MANNQNQQLTNDDILSVLETRNINFDKVFTLEYTQQIIDLLDRVIAYDNLLNYSDDEKYIRFTLNTPGGSIFSLLALLEKIEKMKADGYKVHTHVASMAASCGFILFASGTYKTVSSFAYLLNHQGSSMASGTVKDMEISLELSKKLDEQLNQYLRDNTEMTEEEISRPYVTNTDIWYTADEAISKGIAHKIVNF